MLKKIAVIFIVALVGCNFSALAQADSTFIPNEVQSRDLFWVSPGLGIYGPLNSSASGGASLLVDFNQMKGSTQYKAAIGYHEEFLLFTTPTEKILEIGGLVGAAYHSKNVHLAALGGLGFVYSQQRGSLKSSGWLNAEYTSEDEFGIGVPLRAELYYITGRSFALGLSLYANLNTARSIYGLSGKLSFGRLRP